MEEREGGGGRGGRGDERVVMEGWLYVCDRGEYFSSLSLPSPPHMQAHEKYFKIEVGVHAPVLILPVGEHSDQGLMVDLGSLAIRNTLLTPDQSQVRVGIDAYGIKLDSFKVSRWVK